MDIGQRIEYQTGRAEFGFGVVTAYDDEMETVTVRDEDDGSIWNGPIDLTRETDF